MMRHLKHPVRALTLIRPKLTQLWNRYQSSKKNPELRLQKVFKHAKDIQVVQIGANDGKTGDPIFNLLKINPTWKALFIEPVPFLFQKLQQNYGADPRFRYENVAISQKADLLPFYYVEASAKEHLTDLPNWYDQLGSFRADHITTCLGNQMRPYIATIQVSAQPLLAVLERNQIDRIDLLHIDTEGSDWMILRNLDLRRYAPKVILVEHQHLAPEEKLELQRFLQGQYRIIDLDCDYFCLKASRVASTIS